MSDLTTSRRQFLQAGVAAGVGAVGGGAALAETLDPEIARELGNRLKYLSPPDGISPDLRARPSPCVKPFSTNLFVPRQARPLIDLTDYGLWRIVEHRPGHPSRSWKLKHADGRDVQLSTSEQDELGELLDWWMTRFQRDNVITAEERRHLKLKDKTWLVVFWHEFQKLSEKLLLRGVDIGHFPIPSAHQRFFDFKPLKFYAYWEVEFPWVFSDANCKPGKNELDPTGRPAKGAKWKKGSWSWGFAQLAEGWDDGAKESAGDGLQRPQPISLDLLQLEASSPGPTFYARYGEPILVRRINRLPEILDDDHRFPAGSARRNIKFALPSTTTHLHNAHTASESDGHPNDWINPGEYWDHHYGNFASGYDNLEKLTTLWYHDHRMDFTASNVYAGLDGFYFLFDERPKVGESQKNLIQQQEGDLNDETQGWRLPSGEYDIPLILHDLLFDRDTDGTAQLVFDGFNTDGILGDRFTVNRVIQPKYKVKRRKYRFRILNGGPSRFYELFLHTNNAKEFFPAANPESPSAPFILICGDGNFQPNPLLARSVYLGVAQRTDVVIDFAQFPADCKHVYLVNRLQQVNGKGPNGRQDGPEGAAPESLDAFFNKFALVRFDLEGGEPDDPSRVPLKLRDFPPIDLTEVRRERQWNFDYDGGLWTINGMTYDPNRIDAGIEQDSAEIWTFRNVGNSWSHPIHSHFTEFMVLEINGVPQYQQQIQTSEVPRRGDGKAAFPSFDEIQRQELNDEVLDKKFGDVQDNKQYELPDVKADVARSIPKGLNDRVDELRKLLKEQPRKQTNYYRFILHLIVHLIKDANSPAPKYDLIRDGLFALLQSTETPQELFSQVRFESLKQFEQAVKLLQDKEALSGIVLAVLDLRSIDNRVQGDGRFMGGPRRDVALILPNWEVKVFMRWKDFLGKHVMHCHNVVHEDHAMMIRWDIVPPGHGFDTPKSTRQVYGEKDDTPHVQPTPAQATNHEEDTDRPRGR